MRRYLAAGLLFVLVAQASGSAVAATPDFSSRGFNLGAQIALLLSTIEDSAIVAQLSGNGERYALMHSPKPVFAAHAQMRVAINDNVTHNRNVSLRINPRRINCLDGIRRKCVVSTDCLLIRLRQGSVREGV